MDGTKDITALLVNWKNGDEDAGEALMPLVYAELYRRAANLFRAERPGHTLQPTALINEAYTRLLGAKVSWNDRVHFFAMASRMMRRILIDHAKSKAAQKRGGNRVRVTYDEARISADLFEPELLDLVGALEQLKNENERMSESVDMHYFGGLTIKEIQTVTGQSVATIGRDLRFAKAWLSDVLDFKE